MMASAQLKGMARYGVTGTVKHFAANNQEYHRRLLDSVMSERALREIYLRGFEIAVKEGKAYSIMTTYGAINGLWTASNYDLLTTILRKESVSYTHLDVYKRQVPLGLMGLFYHRCSGNGNLFVTNQQVCP